MTDLSPAAQAVLDAFAADNYGVWLEGDPERLAAALQAAADQLVPVEEEKPLRLALRPRWDARQLIRAEILAIASELEGSN